MVNYIPEIPFAEFKKLKASELKKLKSFGISSNGELLMIAIIPRTDYIADQADKLGELSNSVGGDDIVIDKEVNYAK